MTDYTWSDAPPSTEEPATTPEQQQQSSAWGQLKGVTHNLDTSKHEWVDADPNGSPPKSSFWLGNKELQATWDTLDPVTKQLYGFSMNLNYGLSESLAGAAQMMLDMARPKLGEAAYKRLSENIPVYDRAEFKALLPPDVQDSTAGAAGYFVGIGAPDVALGAYAPIPKTATGRILSNTLLGGLSGAMTYVNPEDKAQSRAGNALFSAGTSMLFSGVLETALNRTNRALSIQRDLVDPVDIDDMASAWAPVGEQRMLAHRAIDVQRQYNAYAAKMEERGWPLSLEQRYSGPKAENVAGVARGRHPEKTFVWDNAQVIKAHDEFIKIIDAVNSPDQTILSKANIGERLADSTDVLMRKLANDRENTWITGINKLVETTGNQHVVPVEDAISKIDRVMGDITADTLDSHAIAKRQALLKLRADLVERSGYDRMGVDTRKFPTEWQLPVPDNPSLGKLTVKQYSDILVNLNAQINDTKDVATKAALIRSKRILQDTLDTVAVRSDVPDAVNKAAKGLLAVRDRYKLDSDAIALTVSAPLRKLLRSNNPILGEQVLGLFDKMPASALRNFMNHMDEVSPGTANLLRKRALIAAYDYGVEMGRKAAVRGEFEFNVEAVLKKLPKDAQLSALFGGVPTTRSQVTYYMEAAKRLGLLPSAAKGISEQEAKQSLARIGGNIGYRTVKGDIPFEQLPWGLGWMSKYGSGKVVMSYLMTTEGRQALMAADKAATKWRRAVQILGPGSASMLKTLEQERLATMGDLMAHALAYHMTEGKDAKEPSSETLTVPENSNAGK